MATAGTDFPGREPYFWYGVRAITSPPVIVADAATLICPSPAPKHLGLLVFSMIDIRELVFEYPTKRALFGVSCTISTGSITALVGPNGAGKTTLIRCLAGLQTPFSGSVTLGGVDVHRFPRECHQRMGYLSDFFGVYEGLSVQHCLTYMARAYGVAVEAVPGAVLAAAEKLGIADRLREKAGELSRGLRQRLAIAQAIIHKPEFLLLDEPASGLDPEARHALAELLISLRDGGMTLLVSSHILAELESYCTDLIIMRDGHIADQRRLNATEKPGAPRRLKLELAADMPSLADILAQQAGISGVTRDGLVLRFTFTGDVRAQQDLLKSLVLADTPVAGLSEEKAGLQELYLAHLNSGSAVPSSPIVGKRA